MLFTFDIKRVSTEAGATAVLAVVAKQDSMWKVTCANVGDSRCILIQNGTATTLSVLHHPGVPEEKSRIEKAGGMVTFDRLGNSRVFGVLAVSRAFGDFEFKVPTEMVGLSLLMFVICRLLPSLMLNQ